LEADKLQELLDQADKALYLAKNTGRNRVFRWDEVPDNTSVGNKKESGSQQAKDPSMEVIISMHAVNALTAALTHHDLTTAEHSRQVAEWSVAAAQGLMSPSERFVLEVAGQVHDIGKLGVPTAVLLKPGQLTPEEWEVIDTHSRMGVDIIASAFPCPPLIDILRNHHAWYGGNPREPQALTGKDIPLGARILKIADAFSVMVNGSSYRKARTYAEAMEELRSGAGTQFDPELVEQFIKVILEGSEGRSTPRKSASAAKLGIGLEAERLATAFEAQDRHTMASVASRLTALAAQHNLQSLMELLLQLERLLAEENDVTALAPLMAEVMSLCNTKNGPTAAMARSEEKPLAT
jgi:HD-GYP domain-containing protein (c-di-GMP phosphodiesterase class II)